MISSEAVTRGVRVQAKSYYISERSAPERSFFFFAYQVTITNEGPDPVKLLSRHWLITDGAENVEEVRGPGVVGEQPLLTTGESFSYTSACPLPTPTGTLEGTYQMLGQNGERFDAEVSRFELAYREGLN